MKGLRIAGGAVGALLLAWGVLLLVASAVGGREAGAYVVALIFALLGGGLLALSIRGDRGRPCPQCAKRVKPGLLNCPTCDYDFRLPQHAS